MFRMQDRNDDNLSVFLLFYSLLAALFAICADFTNLYLGPEIDPLYVISRETSL